MDKRKAQGILTEENIRELEFYEDGPSGYFYQMSEHLEKIIDEGIAEGRFTEQEAKEDLDIALWYAYACNNVGEYTYYYKAAQWMPDSEKNASGCGTWFYRYSSALTYCGRLQEAWEYAERGIQEEPEYPWGYLQVAKLRSYFGDKNGALAAVDQGLALEPGDYEFLTLREEIEEDCSIEEMEYHWIDPGYDEMLQEGSDDSAAAKIESIAGIVCNRQNLKEIKEVFNSWDWVSDNPYCSFHYEIEGKEIEITFYMNEAALSKMDPDWVRAIKEYLDTGECLTYETEEGDPCQLEFVWIYFNYDINLIYDVTEKQEYMQVCLRRQGWDEDDLEDGENQIQPETAQLYS